MATANPATQATILFVDDEERITLLLDMMFRGEYNVLIANSGAQAVDLLASNQVDVLVSDQRMPGMTGVELLRHAREASPHTIRLLLTGYSDLSAIVGSVNEGEVFRFLNKPWDNAQIRQTIADAVHAARVSQDAVPTQPLSPPSGLQPLAGPAPQVLLVNENQLELQAMSAVLAGLHPTAGAGTLAQALAALEQRDVGVIVTDSRLGEADMADFLRAVKQNYPAITAVALTSTADSKEVIQLINRAQIFRFIPKPMRRSVFQLAVQGAMKEHLRLKANPQLTARYQVERPRGNEDASPLALAVARSLSRLKALFGLKRPA
jgi:serine/threonine-protein kinase